MDGQLATIYIMSASLYYFNTLNHVINVANLYINLRIISSLILSKKMKVTNILC